MTASGRQRLSSSAARRMALAAQGFRDPRPGARVDRRHLRRVMGRLGLLQLDSVPVVIRTQYMPAFSRLGPYEPELLDRIAYTDDEWFEAWCHEASLLPVDDEPLLRWAKSRAREGAIWKGLHRLSVEQPEYVAEVLDQVRDRPLVAGELADPRPSAGGEWWDSRSVGTLALDYLFRVGEVGVRRRAGFTKEFDVLDRIVPDEVRCRPTPSEDDAQRELLDRAGRSLGVAALPDLVDYHRLPKRTAKERVGELVEDGRLTEVDVEGWDRPGYVHVDASIPRRIGACTLLSPFDPVVWNRDRARRLFGFEYKIEIYTPAAQRVHGYYVLPFLLGDELVGRVDCKTDRNAGVLLVLGAFAEPGRDRATVGAALGAALDDLARFVGADRWEVRGSKGDLIDGLRSLTSRR